MAGVGWLMIVGRHNLQVSTGVAGRYIEARLGKPALIRDTSRRSVIQTLTNPIPTLRRLFSSGTAEDALSGMSVGSDFPHAGARTSKVLNGRSPCCVWWLGSNRCGPRADPDRAPASHHHLDLQHQGQRRSFP